MAASPIAPSMREPRTFRPLPEDDAPQVLFFVHIPKCAGSSFRHVLKRWYGPDVMVFDSHDEAELARRVRERPSAPRAIAGHFSYGVHRALACRPVHVSLVRDPVDRLVSLYKHARAIKDHFFHEAAASNSLEGFYEQALRTPRTRGRVLAIQCYFLSRERTFAEARTVIDRRYALLAPADRFDDFLSDCAQMLGEAPPPERAERNMRANDPALNAARRAIADQVRAENPEDMELYRYVCEQFQARRLQSDGPSSGGSARDDQSQSSLRLA